MAQRQTTFPGMIDEIHTSARSWSLRQERLEKSLAICGIRKHAAAWCLAMLTHCLAKNNDLPLWKTNQEIAADPQMAASNGKPLNRHTITKAARQLVELGIMTQVLDKRGGIKRALRTINHSRVREICESSAESGINSREVVYYARKQKMAVDRPAGKPVSDCQGPPNQKAAAALVQDSLTGGPRADFTAEKTLRLLELAATEWKGRLSQTDRTILRDIGNDLRSDVYSVADIDQAIKETSDWLTKKRREGVPINQPVNLFERILIRVSEENLCK